jgi:ABC-type Na+ efflux pump permease subunit
MKVWFVWIVLLGGVGGTVLTKCISGYRRRSRVWAAVGVILMLPVVAFILYLTPGKFMEEGFTLEVALLLFGMLPIIVFGGVLGTVCGAIRDLAPPETSSAHLGD